MSSYIKWWHEDDVDVDVVKETHKCVKINLSGDVFFFRKFRTVLIYSTFTIHVQSILENADVEFHNNPISNNFLLWNINLYF